MDKNRRAAGDPETQLQGKLDQAGAARTARGYRGFAKQRMFRTCYFLRACTVLAASLVASSTQAMPLWSHDPQLAVPDVRLVADECPTGYTLHPRLGLCVEEPTCPEGSTLHPRLHLCVMKPTCPSGATWHPRLHRCVVA